VDTQGADDARDGRDASTLVRGGLGSGPTQYGGRGATIVDASPAPDSSPHSPLPDVMVSPDDAAAAMSSSPRNAARAPSVRRSWQLGSGPTDAAGTTHSSDTSPLPSVSPDAPGRSLPAHAPRGTGSPLTRQEVSSTLPTSHQAWTSGGGAGFEPQNCLSQLRVRLVSHLSVLPPARTSTRRTRTSMRRGGRRATRATPSRRAASVAARRSSWRTRRISTTASHRPRGPPQRQPQLSARCVHDSCQQSQGVSKIGS
jgi:hypothetical protein